MKLLQKWNRKLASMAQQWSDRCIDEYGNIPFHSRDFEFDQLGQTNWVGAAVDGYVDLPGVVEEWFGQNRHYDYERNRCLPGKTCSDYTQVTQTLPYEILLVQKYLGSNK